jgi:hypothetical protein
LLIAALLVAVLRLAVVARLALTLVRLLLETLRTSLDRGLITQALRLTG